MAKSFCNLSQLFFLFLFSFLSGRLLIKSLLYLLTSMETKVAVATSHFHEIRLPNKYMQFNKWLVAYVRNVERGHFCVANLLKTLQS